MADITDLAQKLAFYQAGGKEPGTQTLDKVNTGFGIVDSAIKDVLAIKKAKYEGEKTKVDTAKAQAEIPHIESETADKLRENTPEGMLNDSFTVNENLKRAQTDYYKNNRGKLQNLWYNPTDRTVKDISDFPGGAAEAKQKGYFESNAGTALTNATGPAKETALLGRQKEIERVNVEPSTKLRYNDLRTSLRIAKRLEEGIGWAISNNIDVTGILNYPLARFREYIGSLPADQQAVLTDLRTNFARFGRQMGGTAFTPTERQIFAPIMPETTLPNETNLNRITSAIEELGGRIADEEELSPGIKELYGEKPAPAAAQAPHKKQPNPGGDIESKKAKLRKKLGI